MKKSFSERLLSLVSTSRKKKVETDQTLKVDLTKTVAGAFTETSSKRYEKIKVLGKGGFGCVYLARDCYIGRLIAIKELFRHIKDDKSEHIDRFLQEARISGQVDHPNIVRIFDVNLGEYPSIYMEYLGGGNLEKLIDEAGPLIEFEALAYFKNIISGLIEAHRMGVVHRDMKPQNLLFDHNNCIKITDFGVAHLPIEAGGIDSNNNYFIAGTPCYMAPEQFTKAEVDFRSDLYSAGAIFYEMLTGKRLVEYDKKMAIRDIIKDSTKRENLNLEHFPEEVSIWTRELILKLTKADPDERFQSANEVLDEIHKIESVQDTKPRQDYEETWSDEETKKDMFSDILRLFLVDGVISRPERQELVKRSRRLGISTIAARELEEEVRQEMGLPLKKDLNEFEAEVEKLLRDRHYSKEDKMLIRALGKKLKISLVEQQKIEHNVMVKFHMKEGEIVE